MGTKDENLLVKLVKKSVGLPSGNASCGCGVPPAKVNNCCSTEGTEGSSNECGCESNTTQQHEEQPTKS